VGDRRLGCSKDRLEHSRPSWCSGCSRSRLGCNSDGLACGRSGGHGQEQETNWNEEGSDSLRQKGARYKSMIPITGGGCISTSHGKELKR
jgi:hypothetical protein